MSCYSYKGDDNLDEHDIGFNDYYIHLSLHYLVYSEAPVNMEKEV